MVDGDQTVSGAEPALKLMLQVSKCEAQLGLENIRPDIVQFLLARLIREPLECRDRLASCLGQRPAPTKPTPIRSGESPCVEERS